MFSALEDQDSKHIPTRTHVVLEMMDARAIPNNDLTFLNFRYDLACVMAINTHSQVFTHS